MKYESRCNKNRVFAQCDTLQTQYWHMTCSRLPTISAWNNYSATTILFIDDKGLST